jgi:hypothetical protein
VICAYCGKKITGKYAEMIYLRWVNERTEEYGLHAKCEPLYNGETEDEPDD